GRGSGGARAWRPPGCPCPGTKEHREHEENARGRGGERQDDQDPRGPDRARLPPPALRTGRAAVEEAQGSRRDQCEQGWRPRADRGGAALVQGEALAAPAGSRAVGPVIGGSEPCSSREPCSTSPTTPGPR